MWCNGGRGEGKGREGEGKGRERGEGKGREGEGREGGRKGRKGREGESVFLSPWLHMSTGTTWIFLTLLDMSDDLFDLR